VFWGFQLHHPDVQSVVPKAPLYVTTEKKESVNLVLVKEAPERSCEPAEGNSDGAVNERREVPITSAIVRLSTLFLAAASKYAICWSTVYGTLTEAAEAAEKFAVIPASIVFAI